MDFKGQSKSEVQTTARNGLPLDLAIIHSLVEVNQGTRPAAPPAERVAGAISSSSSNSPNGLELEVDLKPDLKPEVALLDSPDSDSSSDTDTDSDSDSDDSGLGDSKPKDEVESFLQGVAQRSGLGALSFVNDSDDEMDEDVAAKPKKPTTSNELEPEVFIPTFNEVGPTERLEQVGKVLTVIEDAVVVAGEEQKGRDVSGLRALDTDSLLVFDDRQVLGYVYETFGPTHAPLYLVKFTSDFPLDAEKVRIGRTVLHVPERSRFIFPVTLAAMKGSDASNLHDEEPSGYDQRDFSDDEAEQAYVRSLKKNKQNRRRDATPSTSGYYPTGREEDAVTDLTYGASPYDPYDDSVAPQTVVPPRQDRDPYADPPISLPPPNAPPPAQSMSFSQSPPPPISRPTRGRGRARSEKGRGMEGRRGRGRGRDHPASNGFGALPPTIGQPPYRPSPYLPSPQSPQPAFGGPNFVQNTGYWGGPPMHPTTQMQMGGNAPHINPLFAMQWGVGMPGMYGSPPYGFEEYPPYQPQ